MKTNVTEKELKALLFQVRQKFSIQLKIIADELACLHLYGQDYKNRMYEEYSYILEDRE